MKMKNEVNLTLLLALLLVLLDFSNFGAQAKRKNGHHGKKKHQPRFQIKGPRRLCDTIGIVGAGPAGIHMAYLLKQKGFRHITIFEKSNRNSGMSKTINYRGAPQEMGTCYLAPDYEENIVELIKKFTKDSLVDLPQSSIWLDQFPGPMKYENYLITESMKNFKTRNITVAIKSLIAIITKYNALHGQLFGNYKGELMPRPSARVLKRIKGTFMDFLVREKLQFLKPLFLASHTMQGYGHIDEIAALYGLLWNTPKLMASLLGRLIGSNSTGLYLLKHGFQHLWTAIATKENLRIEYSKNIQRVWRTKKHGAWLCWEYSKCKHFDFIVWTPALKRSLQTFHPFHVSEWQLFNKMKPVYFSTSLVNSTGAQRGETPIDYWFDNVLQKREHSVWAQRDSYAAVHKYEGPLYQQGDYPSADDGKRVRTTVVYQYGKSEPTKMQLNNILVNHLNNIGATKVSIRETNIWPYFPRFEPLEIQNGILWDILELQGKYGMWYSGSSVIFESVKSVVEYNKMLVRLMKRPIGHGKNNDDDDDDGDDEDDDDDDDEDDDGNHNRSEREDDGIRRDDNEVEDYDSNS